MAVFSKGKRHSTEFSTSPSRENCSRSAAEVSTPVSKAEKAVASKTILGVNENAAVKKKTAVEKPKKLSPRGPKKKGIHQARRKSWPR